MLRKSSRLLSPIAVIAVAIALVPVQIAAQRTSALVPTRLTQPIDENARITLKGFVHPLANRANDRGPAPDSMALDRLQLVLKRSDAQESTLRKLISDLHTPGSASYHNWLTPDEFGRKFGPSDQDLATVEAWLESHGFNVTKVNPGRQTIEIAGNAAQFRDTFNAQIHKYVVNGETHYANASDPQIPAALAPVVAGFATLNNFHLRSYVRKLGEASYDLKTGKVVPQWTIGSSQPFALSPGDYSVQYDLNPLYTAGTNGSGQTIAIVNESNINIYLVNQFRSLFGLPANPPQIVIDGNDPGLDGINNPDGQNYASAEAYLDVEWAGAVAPNATVDLVIAADTNLDSGLLLALQHAIDGNIAPVVSISFGGCEAAQGATNQFINSLFAQAAAQGQTVLVSSGDSGSAGCDNAKSQYYAVNGQAVNGLASTPYNVAVGGTDFYYSSWNQGAGAIQAQLATYWNTTQSNNQPTVSIKGVIPEQPWNDSQYGLDIQSYYENSGEVATTIAGTGGGASNCALGNYDSNGNTTSCSGGYPKPAWQTGTGVPNDGVRDLPDLSLFASDGANDSFYVICATDGDCQPVSSNGTVQILGVGGTSAAAPSFAGIMALVNQRYGRQGQANFVLYPLAAQFPAAFRDVKVGTNSVPCNVSDTDFGFSPLDCIAVSNPITIADPNYGTAEEGQIGSGTTAEYNATSGYDLASGLGSVDANILVADWSKVSFASSSVTLTSPTAGTYTHGSNITFTATVTGSSPTGNVALLTDNPEAGQQSKGVFALNSGTATGTVNTLPGGTYNVWASYGGDSKNAEAQSGKTLITVNPEASAIYFNLFSPAGTTASGSISPGASIDYGTQLLLSAQVAPSSQLSALENCFTSASQCPTYGIPTGTVTFNDGSSTLKTALVNATGDAEYNAPFSVGPHSVSASYSGDNSYTKSTASAVNFTVAKDTPSISIGAANQDQYGDFITGQPTVLNIQVLNGAAYNYSDPASGILYPVPIAAPTGTVTVTGLPAGTLTATLSPATDPVYRGAAGIAIVTLPAGTPAGSPTVAVNYSGDSNYNSTSASGQIFIVSSGGLASTTTATVTGSISPASTINITGTVIGQSGQGAPTGGIILYSSGYGITEVPITPGSGSASTFSLKLNSQTLSPGTNFVTLQYTGDNTYNPSAYQLSMAVANPLSDFTIVPDAAIIEAPASGSTSEILNISSVNGFSGNVSLSCSATGGVGCSLSTTSASLSSGGSTPVTLTVNTSGVPSGSNYNVRVQGVDSSGHYIHTVGIRVIATATGPTGYRFVPVTPCRVADTRNSNGPFGGPEMSAGSSRAFNIPQSACNIPASAVAYSLNVTVVPNGPLSYLTLWPEGTAQPYVSTLNSDGRVKANAAIVPAGANGGVSVYVTDPTQVILDIDGYFVPAASSSSALQFYPLTPCRIADTRGPSGPLGGPSLTGGSSRAFPILSSSCNIPSTAQAYSLNVTAVPHHTLNYLTTWPTGTTQPYVSTLNSLTGTVVANAALVPAGTSGEVSIFVSDDADVILDVNGYFAPPASGGLSLYAVTPCRVIDTRPAAFGGVKVVSVEGSNCAPPSSAEGYVLNATAVPPGSLNHITLWPDGAAQPYVSTLNALDAAITSNMAIVPTTNGNIDAFASDPVNLILDISGYFAP